MANVFETRIELNVADRFKGPLSTLERLLMRAGERAVTLNSRLRELDRIGATRSQLFNLQNLDRRARLESQMAQQQARVARASAAAQATTGAEQLAAQEQLTAAQQRYDEIREQGERRAEMALIRQNDLLARQGVQRERLVAQQAEVERATRMEQARSLAFKGAVVGAVGVGLDVGAMHLIRQGANLQQAQLLLQMQTGATPAEMQRFGDIASAVSGRTMFDITQTYRLASEMFGGGIGVAAGARRRIDPIQQLLPIYARAAEDINFMSFGQIAPDETIKQLTEIAHQYGAYQPAKMTGITDTLVKLAQILPGQNLQPLATMGGYIVPLLSGMLGVDPNMIMAMEAAGIQRYGAGSVGARGPFSGATQQRFWTQLLHPSRKGTMAEAAMGMLGPGGLPNFLDPAGHVDIMRVIAELQTFRQRMAADPRQRREAAQALGLPAASAPTVIESAAVNAAFQAAGARAALAFMDPQFVSNFQNIVKALPDLLGAIDYQQKLLGLANEQTVRLETNFQKLESHIGIRLVPGFQNLTTSLADAVDRVDRFMTMHPGAATATAYGIAGAGTVLTVAGVSMVAQAAFKALGWQSAGKILGVAMGDAFLAAVIGYFGYEGGKGLLNKYGLGGTTGPLPGGFPWMFPKPAPPATDPSWSAWWNYFGHGTPPPLLPSLTPSAPAPYHAGEPAAAHGGDHIEIHHLEVHYEKSSPADAEKLIADIRRGARSTGASTGGPGVESPGVHGFPIR